MTAGPAPGAYQVQAVIVRPGVVGRITPEAIAIADAPVDRIKQRIAVR